jgi:hypothetical protein
MVRIRFKDSASERRALGYLAGRFSFKTWKSGETVLPEAALPFLAIEGISFSVEGPATYEQIIPPLRDPLAPAV